MSTSCLSDLRPLDNPFVALISRTASRLFPPLAGSKVSVSQQECTLTPPEGVQRGKSEGCGHAMRALREKMPNIMFLFSSKESQNYSCTRMTAKKGCREAKEHNYYFYVLY